MANAFGSIEWKNEEVEEVLRSDKNRTKADLNEAWSDPIDDASDAWRLN